MVLVPRGEGKSFSVGTERNSKRKSPNSAKEGREEGRRANSCLGRALLSPLIPLCVLLRSPRWNFPLLHHFLLRDAASPSPTVLSAAATRVSKIRGVVFTRNISIPPDASWKSGKTSARQWITHQSSTCRWHGGVVGL